MIAHSQISDQELHHKIRKKKVRYAGNKRLKIYGRLSCSSGKRMSKENRVFFSSIKEAEARGFRPCGHCMRAAYNEWKNRPD